MLNRVVASKESGDLQWAADRWGNTGMVSLFIFSDAFAGMTTGERQIKVLEWLGELTPEEQNQIATELYLTHEEQKKRWANPSIPTSGSLLDLTGTDS